MVWDTLERGLALQVRPSGHRAFKFIYSRQGETRWITIGPADAVSLALARETATSLRLQVHQGRDPAAEKRTASAGSGSGTFAVIAARYVEECAKKKNKSWKRAAHLIKRNVTPHWADRDASTISRADAAPCSPG